MRKLPAHAVSLAVAKCMALAAEADGWRRAGITPTLDPSHMPSLLKAVETAVDAAGLKNAKTDMQILALGVANGRFSVLEIGERSRALGQLMINELYHSCLCMIIDDGKAEYWEQPELFGSGVASCFPDASPEIEEAGNCYVAGRNTACVFHLMRAVETALRKWAEDLGTPLRVPATEANWQDILNAADKHLKALEQQPKSSQRTAELEYFAETSLHFRAIKDAWRNHVSHGKRTYDDRKARMIFDHVRAFMEQLASRNPSE